jgi:hypothetical protein
MDTHFETQLVLDLKQAATTTTTTVLQLQALHLHLLIYWQAKGADFIK